MSHEGKFELGKCVQVGTNKLVDVENCREGYEKVKKEVEVSDILLEKDRIGHLLKLSGQDKDK